jgi:hypothetical protein
VALADVIGKGMKDEERAWQARCYGLFGEAG